MDYQLRENEANEAANSIAKSTHHILSSLSDATATWDIEKSIMKAVTVQVSRGRQSEEARSY